MLFPAGTDVIMSAAAKAGGVADTIGNIAATPSAAAIAVFLIMSSRRVIPPLFATPSRIPRKRRLRSLETLVEIKQRTIGPVSSFPWLLFKKETVGPTRDRTGLPFIGGVAQPI